MQRRFALEVFAETRDPTLAAYVIGPLQPWQDFTGDWANMREVRDSGVLLVRPDHHVAWRRETIADNPAAELRRVLAAVFGK